ncbi:hypothetical protein FSARC_4721 [Fusarium sarcochroum]|uniref:F5/8 type C domain-containing protein n=1 Tax=Fusarium sarcochroum TaxID=1208366 RepID=A0A8H4XAA9_9HYPO|nr:hypothetical protein FSARC_4721 [Fusarium sarcochroum]
MKPVHALAVCLGLLEGADAISIPGFAAPKAGWALRPDTPVVSEDKSSHSKAASKAAVKPGSKVKSGSVLPAFNIPKTGFVKPSLGRRVLKSSNTPDGSQESEDDPSGEDPEDDPDEEYEEPMMEPTYVRFGDAATPELASAAPPPKVKSGSKDDSSKSKPAKHGSDDDSVSNGRGRGKGRGKGKGKDDSSSDDDDDGDDDSTKSLSKIEDSTKTDSSDATSTPSSGSKGSKKHSGHNDGTRSRTRTDDSTKTRSADPTQTPSNDDDSKGSGKGRRKGKGKGVPKDDSGKHNDDDDDTTSRSREPEDSTKTTTWSSTKTPSSGSNSNSKGKHTGDDDASKSDKKVEDHHKKKKTSSDAAATATATPAAKKGSSTKHSGSDDAKKSSSNSKSSKGASKVKDSTKKKNSSKNDDSDKKDDSKSKNSKDDSKRSKRWPVFHQSGTTFDPDSPRGGGKNHQGYSSSFNVPKLNKGYIQAVPPQNSNTKKSSFKLKPKPELSRKRDYKVRPLTSSLHKREQILSLRAAAPFESVAIDRSKWTVTCDSVHQGDDCKNAIDGKDDTIWHTQWEGSNPPPPHTITVDMKKVFNVNGVSMLPRQDDSPNGYIAQHQVFLSKDNKNWGSPVAYGTWYADGTVKYANFDTQPARYVRVVAITEAYGNPWTSIAELNVFQANSYMPAQPSMGVWGPTVNFPIIPVAGTVDPTTGKVLVWSSWARDTMDGGPGGLTLTSTWDPATGLVAEREVTQTNHDMFCPGISLDGNGQLVVTGGNNAERTSTFDPVKQAWVPGPDMKVARGYHASATTSTGKVFTIGGSWSGGQSYKNGEVYDPKKKAWTLLKNADVKKMLTNDVQGLFRSDNHAWLFGWKTGTVFQAGPSTAMNWYYTDQKDGSVKTAGQRGSDRGLAPDAMCGNAIMFDAVNGKILTHGGTPNYQDADATSDAHVITIGNPGINATVAYASEGLFHARVFHSSVVLPNGNVFITGGQEYAIPFADTTPQFEPEMYYPDSDQFKLMKPNNIVRVYHSIALLLPDGRVFNGGGGLCGGCDTNHFDAQLYSPPYLYDSKGNLATRPKINSVSAATVKVGGTLTVQANGAIAQASLIRYGTATHTVNSDQRRIPLTLSGAGKNAYSFQVPSDPGVALPGYWMLFVMDKNGVPSVASTIKVTG